MRILISMYNVLGYGGAAMVMLELAETFLTQGHQVDLCAWWAGDPMAGHFKSAGARRLDAIHEVNPFDYDVVCFLHHSAPRHFRVIRPGKVANTLILFFRLSHSSYIGVPSPVLDGLIADKIFVNSDEVKQRMLKQFGVQEKDIYIFHNASPPTFLEVRRTTPRPLQRVIYISNHQNKEVMAALQLLREQGIATTHYGTGGDLQVRITPQILKTADVVITMAKSAQYSLLAGVPLYVYDYEWGGPGYLTRENFDVVCRYNFSGSFSPRRLAPQELAAEVVAGYSQASQFMADMNPSLWEPFRLERVTDHIAELRQQAQSNADRIKRLEQNRSLLNRERAYIEMSYVHFRKWRTAGRDARIRAEANQKAPRVIEKKFIHAQRSVHVVGVDSDYVTKQIGTDNQFYEQSMLDFIQSLGLKGSYVDVGANIGNHTLYFSMFCPSSKVYAIEPLRELYWLLQRNIDLNGVAGRVVAHQVALGDHTGTCNIRVNTLNNLGASEVVPGKDIRVVRLDDILPRNEKVSLVKIDVEGWESKVLHGGVNILARDRPVLFVESRNPDEWKAVEKVLSPLGYQAKKQFNATPTFMYSVNS